LSFTSSSSNAGKVSASKKSFSSVKYLNCFSHVFLCPHADQLCFFFFPMCLHMIDVRCFFGFPQLPILTAQLTPRLWLLTTTVWFYSLRSLDVVRFRWSNELHYDSFWLAVLDMHHSPCLNNAELFLEISWCC
jgi:hypothetical protein